MPPVKGSAKKYKHAPKASVTQQGPAPAKQQKRAGIAYEDVVYFGGSKASRSKQAICCPSSTTG